LLAPASRFEKQNGVGPEPSRGTPFLYI
jgi:hypothetical protein